MTSGVLNPFVANATTVTTATATFGRIKASAPADSIILRFASPTGIQTGGADTISLTFSADFVVAAAVATNFDIGLGNSATCSSATYSDETVALTASASDWGVGVSGQVITFSPETDDTLTAGYCIQIEMGLAATTGGTGSASTITNGAADDDDTIIIGGNFGDSGTLTIEIIDNDQVTMSASVAETITFDLDTATSDTESATNTVNLLSLLYTQVNRSDHSTINSIYMDAATNATGGMTVTVQNANGSDGLKSTSVPADKIVNAAAVMSAGTANYGLCVVSGPTGGLSRAGTYNSGGTCTTASSTNEVEALTTTPLPLIASTSASTAAGRAEVLVNATVTSSTPAHADYADTLTFIATASF
jgi:hypothetical protein